MTNLERTLNASNYRALVRPDTQQVMSVVTSHYVPAENSWVAQATETFARRASHQPPMIAAVGHGREGERTMFAARMAGDAHRAICLLAYNTHGGEGAVRFQIIEADRRTGATYVLDSPHASISFPHVGDLEDRLSSGSSSRMRTFVEEYLDETAELWERFENKLWTPRHSTALILALWGETPDPCVGNTNVLAVQGIDDVKARHPGHHLPAMLSDITDAANAYRAVCEWIDNYSEACERGDFTSDRDERLALGAGNKYKRDAWRWIGLNI